MDHNLKSNVNTQGRPCEKIKYKQQTHHIIRQDK